MGGDNNQRSRAGIIALVVPVWRRNLVSPVSSWAHILFTRHLSSILGFSGVFLRTLVDGTTGLRVETVTGTEIKCRVKVGGHLNSGAGGSAPSASFGTLYYQVNAGRPPLCRKATAGSQLLLRHALPFSLECQNWLVNGAIFP